MNDLSAIKHALLVLLDDLERREATPAAPQLPPVLPKPAPDEPITLELAAQLKGFASVKSLRAWLVKNKVPFRQAHRGIGSVKLADINAALEQLPVAGGKRAAPKAPERERAVQNAVILAMRQR